MIYVFRRVQTLKIRTSRGEAVAREIVDSEALAWSVGEVELIDKVDDDEQ